MKNKLQKSEGTLSLESKTKITELSKAVFHVNQLTGYPLPDAVIMDWAKSISELAPEITPKTIKIVTDKMKVGLIDYDHRKGIQNIFNGYKIVLENYRISIQDSLNKMNQNGIPRSDIKHKELDVEHTRIIKLISSLTKPTKYIY